MLKYLGDTIVVDGPEFGVVLFEAATMIQMRHEVDAWMRWQSNDWLEWAMASDSHADFVAGYTESLLWLDEANRWAAMNDWEWNLEYESTVQSGRWAA